MNKCCGSILVGTAHYHAIFIIAFFFLCNGHPQSQSPHNKWYIKKVSCETPLMEAVGDCAVTILKYFFNQTSQMCESFLWNGCLTDGVYDSRLDCWLNCHPGEKPGVCAERRPDSCVERMNKDRRLPPTGMIAYYYNINNGTCEKFQFCGPPVPLKSNLFTSLTTCIMECRGFSQSHQAKVE